MWPREMVADRDAREGGSHLVRHVPVRANHATTAPRVAALVGPLLMVVGLACAFCLIGADAAAATRVWTGLGGNTAFSTPGNWENNTPPAANGDALVFPDTATNVVANNDIVGLRVASITMRKA